MPQQQQTRGQSYGEGKPPGKGNTNNSGTKRSGADALTTLLSGNTTFKSTDSQITQLENKIAKSLQNETRTSLPPRPSYGTAGTEVTLIANHVEIVVKPTAAIQRYNISVSYAATKADSNLTRDPPTGKKLALIIHRAMSETPDFRNGATDYNSILLTKEKMPDRQIMVQLARTHNNNSANPNAANSLPTFKVSIEHQRPIEVKLLLDHLNDRDGKSSFSHDKEEILQILNIIAGHSFRNPSGDVTRFISRKEGGGSGNKQYSLSGKPITLSSSHIEAWRGFMLSMRLASRRVLLLVQPKYIAAYKPILLSEVLQQKKDDRSHWQRTERLIKKCRISLTHRNALPKTVLGFASEHDENGPQNQPRNSYMSTTASTKFWMEPTATRTGRHVSVQDYFEDKRYPRINHPQLPVINVGSREHPVYVPPEFCKIVAGQPYCLQLEAADTSAMIETSASIPELNIRSIYDDGFPLLRDHSRPSLEKFDLSIDQALIKVNARILPAPVLKYKQAKPSPSNGSWSLKHEGQSLKLSPKIALSRYVFLRIQEPGKETNDTDEFEVARKAFIAKLKDHGIEIAGAADTNEPRDSQGNMIKILETEIDNKMSELKGGAIQIAFVILPKKEPALYNRVKRLGDHVHGLSTVCMTREKFLKCNNDIFANVALKVSLKLEGCNQSLDQGGPLIVRTGKTMIVGLDVTHPSPGSKDTAPSIVGIVASKDKHLGQWPAAVQVQSGGTEMVSALKDLFKDRLKAWQKANNQGMPDDIIVYRDGVSEGQYQHVLNEELPQIKQACVEIYGKGRAEALRLAIIIVAKRHNTRFYPATVSPTTADNNGNTMSGTVVSRDITEARSWDFFLQSHKAIKGTARPIHYVVIYDQVFRRRGRTRCGMDDTAGAMKYAVELVEELTHHLSFMFGRSTRAVSACTPAYYADLVCTRARCWLSRYYDDNNSVGGDGGGDPALGSANSDISIHTDLTNKMFYI